MNMLLGTVLRSFLMVILIVVNIAVFTHSDKRFLRVIMPCFTVTLLYCMFFQGSMRMPRINISSLEITADKIESGDIKEGLYHNKEGNCLITVYESDSFEMRIQGETAFPKSLYEKTGVLSNGKKYFFSPLESCRQSEGLYMHNWYDGIVFLALDEKRILEIDYSVDRRIDDMLGFLCAPPILKEIDFLLWLQTGTRTE